MLSVKRQKHIPQGELKVLIEAKERKAIKQEAKN